MKKTFLIALIFTKIISLTANAQQSEPLIPAIQDLIRKAGANKQGPMTATRLLSVQSSGIEPQVKSWLDEHEESIIGTLGGPFQPDKGSKLD